MTFRNLTPGSIVHVLVKGEPIEYQEGTVVSVGTPVYKLAIDKLTDKDGVFNIRKYFNL